MTLVGKTISSTFKSLLRVDDNLNGVGAGLKDVTDGELGKAFNTLSSNAVNMIGSDTGRKTLVTASGIALLGAFARKQFPQLKLGGSKFYFRL